MWPGYNHRLIQEPPPRFPRVELALHTELSHFRPRRSLLCRSLLRSVARPYPMTQPLPYVELGPEQVSRSRQATPGPSKSAVTPSEDDEAGGHDITRLPEPDADGLIPKPAGEVGRKKRGYSLQHVLGWDDATFKAVKEQVSTDIAKYLNHCYSVAHQPAGHVEDVTKLVSHFL